MAPGLFVLAILGCGEGDAPCQQVAIDSARYASAQACNDATADAVERYQDISYPVVVAQCRAAGAKLSQPLMSPDVTIPGADMPEDRPVPRTERARARAEEGARI